ncbi:GIY-YIG nuclease family protein [Rhizobium sp. G187]|uniref:GIY-YIG nuclease family protein n=1 Tax=Rhizobium sp. G187 TaxID=3451352 RepID=UPI003EE50538
MSELLNGLTGDISAKLGFAEGSPEKTALHAAVGAIVAQMAGGDVGSGALAGAVSEIANGIVQDLLKANPDLTDAQKASLTQWAAVAVGAAVGGQLGAATALDNVNYNYLNHQDAAALAAARRACASGDQAACQIASTLEAKDAKQQEDYLACRSTGFGAAGCNAVLADVTAALSSYSGIAPFTLSDSERLAILDSNGNLDQIIKILAPHGAASLADDKQRELATLVNLLTGDITGITATPAALQEIANGDVTSFAQVLGLLTRNTALKALGKVKGDAGGSGETVDGNAGSLPNASNSTTIGGKTCVYSCVVDGTTRYLGITDDVARRGREHFNTKGLRIEQIDGLDDLSRSDARAVEQTLIHYYGLGKDGGTLLNKINSISPTRNTTAYEQSLIRGKELLDSVDYQWTN